MLILATLIAAAQPAAQPAAEPAAEPAPEPANVAVSEETDELAFDYAWPAAAERDPALAAELRRRLAAARREALRYVREDRRERPAEAPFNPHSYSAHWTVDGTAGPLTSLSASVETYTGGAHGNLQYETLLWDSATRRAADVHAVLGPALTGLTPRYCAALDAQRAEKRGEPVDHDEMFGDCPAIAEQPVTPADADGNGRFDRVSVLLPPYAAGPYVEGDYVVEIPLEAGDVDAIPAAWRASFEVAPAPAGERG